MSHPSISSSNAPDPLAQFNTDYTNILNGKSQDWQKVLDDSVNNPSQE